jgi:hypothetical protein
MVPPESLPAEVLAEAERCDLCETDRRPRMFICAYHDGWWDGWLARAVEDDQ